MEKWKKDTATEAVTVYQHATLGNAVCQMVGVVLHHSCIEEILNWTMTKEYLDAYLASAR